MLFLLAVILLLSTAGFCWIKADEALADDDVAAAGGYAALYVGVAAITMLGVV